MCLWLNRNPHDPVASRPDTKPSQGVVLSDFWTEAIDRTGVLDKTLVGLMRRDRVPAVAVDADAILTPTLAVWTSQARSPAGVLDAILAGTGYYKPCLGQEPRGPAAELFTTSPHRPAGAVRLGRE